MVWLHGDAITADFMGGRALTDGKSGTISESHKDALLKRGLRPDLCERLGVHTIPTVGIGFPYIVGGELHNTKVRAPGKRMWFAQAGKDLRLWNLDSLKGEPLPGEPVVITEGEFDGIAALQAGFSRVVSVPNGAPKHSDEHAEGRYKFLFRGNSLIPDLEKFREIGRFILAVDGDGPGRNLRDALAVRIGDERCFWVDWPPGIKDANDVLKPERGGTQEEREAKLRQIILSAKPMWNDEISTLDDIPEPSNEIKNYPVSIPKLEQYVKIELPEFLIMMGPYHCGKSVFLRQLLWDLWKTHQWRFLLTSLEERVKPRIRDHFRTLDLGRKPVTDAEINLADSRIRAAALFLQRPPYPTLLTADHFFDRVELAVRRDGVRVVALDPVNELEHAVGRNESQYWARFIGQCKQLADQYKLLFIVCGHPPKDVYQRIGRDKMLHLSDMSGSSHWGNKADRGLLFWRPEETGPTIMFQEKTKDHDSMGDPFLSELALDRKKNSFDVSRIGWDIIEKAEFKKGRGSGSGWFKNQEKEE